MQSFGMRDVESRDYSPADNGCAMLSSDLPSASIPSHASMPDAISISTAASA